MKDRVCTSCYHVGKPTTQGIESFFMDALIWLCFTSFALLSSFIPIMIVPVAWTTYHIAVYRKTTCPKCGRLNMVSMTSRKGREALRGPKWVISYSAADEAAKSDATATGVPAAAPERRRSRD
jgi:hypothetical protein